MDLRKGVGDGFNGSVVSSSGSVRLHDVMQRFRCLLDGWDSESRARAQGAGILKILKIW